jgi:hypothetical protein
MYKTSGRMLKWLGPVAEFTLGQVDRTNEHSPFVRLTMGRRTTPFRRAMSLKNIG